MTDWFVREFVHTGRLPLLLFFLGMVAGFGFIRLSVRLIRAQVRWWPGNVTPGELHIHHAVFGVVFMLFGGIAGLAIPDDLVGWRASMAALFGIGAALVLDEFALLLHLRDVYWTKEGRLSLDAVFAAFAMTGMLLLGLRPVVIDDVLQVQDGGLPLAIAIAIADVGLAVITLLKGKIWTGLIGLYLPLLTVIGALRVARPGSPWAHRRYHPYGRKLAKARWRERQLRRPIVRGKIWLQEVIAGKHDERNPT